MARAVDGFAVSVEELRETMARILLVDDSEDVRLALATILRTPDTKSWKVPMAPKSLT